MAVSNTPKTPGLPPLRRVVTGHDSSGRALIESDTSLTPFDPRKALEPSSASHAEGDKGPDAGFILLWRTDGFPTVNQGPWEDYHKMAIPLSDETATVVRTVDMPPGLSSPLHRTLSLDLGVVLSGEVVLELDDGVETVVKQGETVVQRGTIHAWHNRTQRMTRILFVLVPAKKIDIGGKVLEKTQFSVN